MNANNKNLSVFIGVFLGIVIVVGAYVWINYFSPVSKKEQQIKNDEESLFLPTTDFPFQEFDSSEYKYSFFADTANEIIKRLK